MHGRQRNNRLLVSVMLVPFSLCPQGKHRVHKRRYAVVQGSDLNQRHDKKLHVFLLHGAIFVVFQLLQHRHDGKIRFVLRLDSLKNCPYFPDVPCLIHLAQRAKESLKLREDGSARIFFTHLFPQILDCGFSVQKQPVIVVPNWICAAVRLEAVWLHDKAEKRQNIDGSPAVQ